MHPDKLFRIVFVPRHPGGETMSNELAVRQEFNDEQVALLRRTICNGASNDELALFLNQCRRTGLDPFARQIYLVKRKGKMVVQTGIDGYRLIADRTGLYAGNDDPVFDDENASGIPSKASVTVWKMVSGVRCPFTATARWSQYCPDAGQDFMWKKMPHVMLGKCAESLALRKAFPQELSGLYTSDEMEQAGPPDATNAGKVPAPSKATGGALAPRSDDLFALLDQLAAIENRDVTDMIGELFRAMKIDAASLDDLTPDQIRAGCRAVRGRIDKARSADVADLIGTTTEPTDIAALAR